MKKSDKAFVERIKTSENRSLYLTVKKVYGSFNKFSREFGFSRQYCQEMMKKGVPMQYASFLARKCGFKPALLNYKVYVLMGGKLSYKAILTSETFFTDEEKKYILKGSRIRSPRLFLETFDEDFVGKREVRI